MPTQDGGGSVDRLLDELVALERSALDRWIRPSGLPRPPSPRSDLFRSVYGKARRWAGRDAVAAGADEENEAAVHGSTIRHDRSQSSASWRCSASDIQPCQLRETARCSPQPLAPLPSHLYLFS